MSRIHIVVEGQTEARFVEQVLTPHFYQIGVYIEKPVIVATRYLKDAPNIKGGITSYGQVRRDLIPLFKDSGIALITTMFDFYALPNDFPGKQTLPATADCYSQVRHVEQEFALKIAQSKFYPYFSLHEFEALLFVDLHTTASFFPQEPQGLVKLQVNKGKLSPEEINDDPQTAPSKRILNIFPKYKKVTDGTQIALKVGLEQIRKECPHFDEWVTYLEKLGETPY